MSALRFNGSLWSVEKGQRVKDVLTHDRLNALGALSREAASGKNIRGGPGLRVRNGPSGVTITTRRTRGYYPPLHPFRAGGIRIPGNTVKVQPGTVNGYFSSSGYTIGGFSGAENEFLMARVEGDMEISSEGYVISGEVDSWSLVRTTVIPDDDPVNFIYYRCIAQYYQKKVAQPVVNSLEIMFIDDGLGDSNALARWGTSG